MSTIRETILQADDVETVPFLTEWKDADGRQVTVHIKSLTVEQIEAHANSMRGKDGQADPKRAKGAMSRLIARSVVDEHGHRVFQPADVDAIQKKNGKNVASLVNAINELNGFDEDDQALMRDFENDQNEDSSTD